MWNIVIVGSHIQAAHPRMRTIPKGIRFNRVLYVNRAGPPLSQSRHTLHRGNAPVHRTNRHWLRLSIP